MMNDQLCKAVLIWTGFETASFPRRDDLSLAREFPAEFAKSLLSHVKQLEDDFYQSTAYFNTPTLAAMHAAAIADFKLKHPELPNQIAEAFAWCYTYDYR